jgi:cobalt-zinc-cadmium efflux system membrane fusion protein
LLVAAGVAATPACSGRAASPAAEVASTAHVPGTAVVLPHDSSMLAQLTRVPVRMVDLPVDEIVAPGKLEANPNRVAKIVLPVTGRVARVLVRTGDAVHAGQPLLTVDSPDADAAMSASLSSQAGVTQAQAALTKAQADFDRASDLFAHDAVAKKDVLAAENALTQAKAGLAQAKASLEQAQRRISVLGLTPGNFEQQVVVRSPLAGKVLDLSVVQGEFRNDASVPLMTIADLSTVWVTSQVAEGDIRLIHVGERVEISLVAYPGETFEGRVSRIADTVDPQTRTVKVQAEMDNRRGGLRPEMYGSIHHIASTAPTAVVPAGAVLESDQHAVVFVETAPGRFEQRDVSIGAHVGDLVRVTKGVKAGDLVVVDGAMLLKGLRGAK